MTPEECERALNILAQMEITPGKGREREENWIHVIADAIRQAVTEERNRILAIVAGGDRPWQELAQAIRAQVEP